jgi:hypothetical protein
MFLAWNRNHSYINLETDLPIMLIWNVTADFLAPHVTLTFKLQINLKVIYCIICIPQVLFFFNSNILNMWVLGGTFVPVHVVNTP